MALQGLVREHAGEAERARRLSEVVAKAFAEAGLYRVAAPAAFGGAEADPVTQIEAIEAISYADGSAGWNLMIGIEAFGLVAPALTSCADLIEDPAVVMSAATSAIGRADEADGGYRVSGQWQFVSGCHNSQVFAGTVARHRGGRRLDEPLHFAVARREEFEILDTWHVGGLRGSGSHDVRLHELWVPTERVVPRATTGPGPRSTLQHIPLGVRLAYNKVGVAFGIARAAVDCFTELAMGKTPRFSTGRLRERPFVQRALATAEVRLRSARALVFELAEEIWEAASQRQRLDNAARAIFQIACSDAAVAAAEAVDRVAEAAGTTANQLGHPLERLARDVRVVRQHVTVAPHHIEDGGRVLLGLPASGLMLDPSFFE